MRCFDRFHAEDRRPTTTSNAMGTRVASAAYGQSFAGAIFDLRLPDPGNYPESLAKRRCGATEPADDRSMRRRAFYTAELEQYLLENSSRYSGVFLDGGIQALHRIWRQHADSPLKSRRQQ
jgi:hypothetical protein